MRTSIASVRASLLAPFFLVATAIADEPPQWQTHINLNVSVSEQITNDVMTASLYVESHDSDAKTLSERNTLVVNQVMTMLKSKPGVDVSSGSRVMSPVYGETMDKPLKSQLNGWREHIDLRASSRDFAILSQAISELPDGVRISGLDFSVSSAAQAAHRSELEARAMEAFHIKARNIARAMGAIEYGVIDMNVDEPGIQPIGRPTMRTMSMAGAEKMDVDGGRSTFHMNLSGRISLSKRQFSVEE